MSVAVSVAVSLVASERARSSTAASLLCRSPCQPTAEEREELVPSSAGRHSDICCDIAEPERHPHSCSRVL